VWHKGRMWRDRVRGRAFVWCASLVVGVHRRGRSRAARAGGSTSVCVVLTVTVTRFFFYKKM